MPYRRRYKRKSRKSSKRMSTMKRLLYNANITAKLMKINTRNLFYGVREVNELEDEAGKLTLQDNASANQLPLHIIPLMNVRNNNVAGNGILVLKTNGYDFTKLADVELLDTSGYTYDNVSAIKYPKALQRYIDARFMLWASNKKRLRFEISLVQIKHVDLEPILTEADVTRRQAKILFYKYHFLRHQVSNPLTRNENYTKNLRNKYRILWTRKYNIDEKLSDRDESFHKVVKFFKKTDRIVRYTDNISISDTNLDDPDIVKGQGVIPGIQNEPDVLHNLYLIITANTTLSQAEDAVNFQTATYDLSTRVKYTILGDDDNVVV